MIQFNKDFQDLVEDCKSIMSAFLPVVVESTLSLHWFMGKRISEAEKNYQGNTEFYEELAKELNVSLSTIYKELAFYKKYPNLAKSDNEIDINPLYNEYKKPSWYKITKGLTIAKEVEKSEKAKIVEEPVKALKEIEPKEITEVTVIPKLKTMDIYQLPVYIKKTGIKRLAVIDSNNIIQEIIDIKETKDMFMTLIKEFYGNVKAANKQEWKYAKMLLQDYEIKDILDIIQKVKNNRKGYYSKNCASLRYLYMYYPEIYKEQNKKELPTKEDFEEYAKLHPEWT